MSIIYLLPFVSINFLDANALNWRRGNAFDVNFNVSCCLSDDPSQGIAEGLIKSTQFIDEVEVAVLD